MSGSRAAAPLERLWAGEFGDEYTERNRSAETGRAASGSPRPTPLGHAPRDSGFLSEGEGRWDDLTYWVFEKRG